MENQTDNETLISQMPADRAAQMADARLEQRRALVRALSVAAPVAIALSLAKPAFAAS